jgi:OmcA/MtrC family decaheme c-type cytochrome
LPPIEAVSNVVFAVNGADLDVTFDLAADGQPATGYDQAQRGYRTDGLTRTDVCEAPSRSDPCLETNITLTENATPGNYTLKVLGEAAAAATPNRWLFRVGLGADRETRVYFTADEPTTPVEIEAPVVSAAACTACHGPERLSSIHGGYYPAAEGIATCQVCHGVEDPDAPGTLVPSVAAVAHGYHSSVESWKDPVEEIVPHVTYPTYMNNCSVCHEPPDNLLAANSLAIDAAGCFSCHGSIEGIPFPDDATTTLHANATVNTDCATGCHAANGIASDFLTVTDVHNGATTERGGVIVDGVDTSVTEGEKFVWEITGVADDGTNLAITWQASYDGNGVDPCNAVVSATAPVFHAGDGSLRIYRSYAQGDDFIIGADTGGPGQPARANVTTENTVCAGNVATTTIPVEAIDADKGRLVLGGKPLVVNPADAADTMGARVPTPTFDWLVGVGGKALDRRTVVDTSLCLQCHVGSLYQHGGDRVDNVDMCLVCHNSAANEQSVRVGLGVDASEAYDGKAGETFEMKTMLHRIHSAGAENSPTYLVYRNRGIYAFGPDESAIPNWPGTGPQVVFGSDFGTDGTPGDAVINHNFHAPTYPRGIYDCAACHPADFASVIPDQTKAMATTTDAGNEACAPGTECDWSDQLDDTLQGAGTTACITCHKAGATKGHAYQNSWEPQVFPEGRKTIIDSVN